MVSSILKYPNKSHRKTVFLPPESVKLAELIGIILGDGGIGNPWQLVITLNSNSDLDYSRFVSDLISNLFKIAVRIRKRPNQNTLVLVSSSIDLVDFLITKGVVRGNKILQQINIPSWIKGKKDYEKAFVRGLVDTDGCLYIHKHFIKGKLYRNIGFCFTSMSVNLVISIADILTKNGVHPYVTDKGRRIYLYNQKAVLQYLNIFGSSNSRIYNKYMIWRGV